MLCKKPLALLGGRFGAPIFASAASSSTKVPSAETRPHNDPQKAWKERQELAKPTIQRFERPLAPKLYYAPDWEIDFSEEKGEEYSPLKWYGMTPEKWEYYNKVVWPPHYVVPETGQPKPQEVYHCRESMHYSPKRMWTVCEFVRRMTVKDALLQLRFKQTKGCQLLAEIITEARDRAKKEFKIEKADEMFVAEAFPIQSHIVKGARRHARENWNTIRYRYINVFVRLEKGTPPTYKGREKTDDGWEKMEKYYEYLRNRDIKYSL
ncbi:Protein MRPL-22 [Aphelenchoides avenae]|nr:Protein MRPL-22 [Aphelenchus avenae]